MQNDLFIFIQHALYKLKNCINKNYFFQHATENYNVDANNKHKVNSTKTVFDNGNSANIMEEKSRSKQENDFKPKDSTFNNKNAYDKERDVLPQNKMENQVLKDTFHHEFKQTSLNKDTIKQDDKSYTKR